MKGFLLMPFLGLISGTPVGAAVFPSAVSSPVPSSPVSPVASASPTPALSFSRQTKILGQTFGVDYSAQPNAAQSGVSEVFNATILGKQKSLLQLNVQPSPDFSQGQVQAYVNGVQISATQSPFNQWDWNYQLALPPLNINATIVTVPVGPIVIQVDGGYSLSGALDMGLALAPGAPARGTPTETTAPTPESVQASVEASIAAAGYVEGSVNFWLIRGGLDGQVNAADGAVTTKASLYLGNSAPTFAAQGSLGFFAGSVSAFADYYGFLSGWHRFWNPTLFSWNGLCFNFDNNVQVGGTCAVQ